MSEAKKEELRAGERTGRQWWPAIEDEWCKAGRAHPNEWIRRNEDQTFVLLDPTMRDEAVDDGAPLTEGDSKHFTFYERYRAVDVEIKPDGTYEVTAGSIPHGANEFWHDDEENAFGSLKEVVDDYLNDERITTPETIEVELGHWSRNIPYTFGILAGLPFFEIDADALAVAEGRAVAETPKPSGRTIAGADDLPFSPVICRVDGAALAEGLRDLDLVVERRNMIPILAHAQLVRTGSALVLTATDLDTQIVVKVPCTDDGQDGRTTFELATAARIVSAAQGLVTLNSRTTGQLTFPTLEFQVAASVFSLSSLPPEDFPLMTAADAEHAFTIASDQLLAGIETIQFAISKEETRFYLNGIYLHVVDGRLRFAATDGHRLAWREFALPPGAEAIPSVIIPRKTVAVLKDMLKRRGAGVSVLVSLHGTAKISFTFGNAVITSKLVDATYPDYVRIVPSETGNRIGVNACELIVALERAAAISRQRGIAIHLALDERTNDETLPLFPQTAESWHRGVIGASIAGDPPRTAVNVDYLLQIANVSPAPDLSLEQAERTSPIRIRVRDRDDIGFVLMPMNA